MLNWLLGKQDFLLSPGAGKACLEWGADNVVEQESSVDE